MKAAIIGLLFGFLFLNSGCVTRHALSSKPTSQQITSGYGTSLTFSGSIPHAASGWRVVAHDTFSENGEDGDISEQAVSVFVRNLSPNPLGVGIGRGFAQTLNAPNAYFVLEKDEVRGIFTGKLGEFIRYSQGVQINNDATFSQKRERLEFEIIFEFPDRKLVGGSGRLRFIDTNAL